MPIANDIAHVIRMEDSCLTLLTAWAGVGRAARFAPQLHYASDIALGSFIGRSVYRAHEDHAGHRHVWQTQPVPAVDPLIRSYTTSLRLSRIRSNGRAFRW